MGVDVLIIAALQLEFDAARLAGLAPAERWPGIPRWEERDADGPTPYLLGECAGPVGVRLSVALARSIRMGVRSTAPVAAALAERLKPRCLAMSGVCAGNPTHTALGDVVVAELVYAYDEGTLTTGGFQADHRQLSLDEKLMRAAQDLPSEKLPSFGAASDDEARIWFLEQLLAGRDPRTSPARERYYPGGSWKAGLEGIKRDGLITWGDGGWALTRAGRSFVERRIYDDAGGPDVLPFRVVVGPVATGNVVVRDGDTWDRLSAPGVRTVTGLDMEAAAIATIAKSQAIPYWLVAKGVMDHADRRKDDRHRRFAARASAEALFALVTNLARTTVDHERDGQPGGGDPDWLANLQDSGLHVWTDADFQAGLATSGATDDHPPMEEDDIVDAVLLRAGRLPNLQRDFSGLGRAFDNWAASGRRKRGEGGLRVLWIVGDGGPHRSRALLAALSRAGGVENVVHDAGRDLHLAATAIEALVRAGLPAPPRFVAVDLGADQPDAGWNDVRDVMRRARRRAARQRPYPLLVVGGSAAQEQAAYDIVKPLIEIEPVDVNGRQHQRPYSDAGANSMASPSLAADDIFNRGLPRTTHKLFGRDSELTALRHAWASEQTRILSIVASGGVGKSALVNHWLREMRGHDYLGARKLLAWSFYSQGTKENMVSADAFVIFALEWLGGEAAASMSPLDRGMRLAKLIKEHHLLLVLDGMEPLQYPMSAPDVGGRLTDTSMAVLLQELATPDWRGLCLITTRVPLTDLDADGGFAPEHAVVSWNLDNLDDRSGAELLQHLIGRPAGFPELRQAAREVEGHALAINLLGRYLRDVHNGQLSGRFELERLAVAVADGGHARRIMETYARWLERYDRRGELAVSHIVGLFDRPAPHDAMAAVVAGTELGRSAPDLEYVGSVEWNRCVDELRRMGLLNGELPDLPGTLDAHPLVREHFRDRLRERDGALWEAGNRALFEHYQRRAPELPANASDMNLLYAAVNHGCAIGLHQQVFDDILVPRVWRGTRTSFSTRHLGMTGSEIVALSNYFKLPRWTELRDISLSQQARLIVMANACLRLRQLGRLDDARDSCGAVLTAVDPHTDQPADLENAAYTAALHCELLVIAGRLHAPASASEDTARASALRAIEFADRGHDPYFSMYARSCLAEVDFMAGDLDRAGKRFRDAMAIGDTNPPFLYSQNLFRYGYYLIETGRAEKILTDSGSDPGWGLNGGDSSLLSHAIQRLTRGAARRSLVEDGAYDPTAMSQAKELVDEAIVMFRSVGYTDYLVRGLLERAHLLRVRRDPEDYPKVLDDLDKATVETTRGNMRLLSADVVLQRAACYLAYWPTMSGPGRLDARARVDGALADATELVRAAGYGRRSGMLADLKGLATRHGIA